jgi:hypothetical protein
MTLCPFKRLTKGSPFAGIVQKNGLSPGLEVTRECVQRKSQRLGLLDKKNVFGRQGPSLHALVVDLYALVVDLYALALINLFQVSNLQRQGLTIKVFQENHDVKREKVQKLTNHSNHPYHKRKVVNPSLSPCLTRTWTWKGNLI